MKKKLLFLILSIFILTGCKKDDMQNISIYTTIYPVEYITKTLYSEYSDVYSIYPNEIIELSDKLINDYSMTDLFIYNGLSNEIDYAVEMLNNNKNLKIVDATMGMKIEKGVEELWLNPSNFLMLALNVKNGMEEYITNAILRKEIDDNYNKLKIEISALDAEIKMLSLNADNNSILVSNDIFTFMDKYDLKIYSFDNKTVNEKTKSLVEDEIKKGNIKYIFMLPDDELSEDIENFLADNHIEKLYFNPLTTLSSEDRNVEKNYLSIMEENIGLLKQESYDEE